MDLNMKQWRYQQQHESDLQQPTSSAKLTRHLLDPQLQQQQQQQTPPAFPLFEPELTGNLSADSTNPATRFPKKEMGSYFSLGQWQELELQALIFRHMLAGAAIPPQLLHLVKKSLLNASPSPPHNYLHQQLQHYPHYQPPILQSGSGGYWGRGGMDPEPGRCRRTDGKKWRCSRDVVAGHKYCERHMHRGRQRSRKPVEIPTPPSSSSAGCPSGGGGLKAFNSSTPQPLPAMAAGTHFNLSGLSPSIDLFHLNRRPSDSITENKGGQLETQNEVSAGDENSSGGQVLRHFFDDWPRSLQDQPENASSVITPSSSSCSHSICSTSSNPNSDFSLKLSTGNININDGDHPGGGGGGGGGGRSGGVGGGQQLQLNWAASWGTNQVVGPMGPGGPLAEALRSSSTSSSSPTSVLNRSSKSDTSYVTT